MSNKENCQMQINRLTRASLCLLLLASSFLLCFSLTGRMYGIPQEFSPEIYLASSAWILPLLSITIFMALANVRVVTKRMRIAEHIVLGTLICAFFLAIVLLEKLWVLIFVPVTLIALSYGSLAAVLVTVVFFVWFAIRGIGFNDKELFYAFFIITGTLAYLIGGLIQLSNRLINSLEKEKATFKTLVDSLPQGICFIGDSTRCLYKNPKMGVVEDRLSERVYYDPKSLGNWPTEGNVQGAEIDFEGGSYRVSCCKCTRDDVSGKIIIIEDVTETKRLQEQVLKSSYLAAVGEMAAGVAHELRNPLTSIMGYAQLLLEQKDTKTLKDVRGYLDTVFSELQRLSGIISQFLNLARPQTTKREMVNLNALIEETKLLLSHEALRLGVELRIVLDPNLEETFADPAGIKQVVLNLAGNGLQASGERGWVEVSTRSDKQYIYMEVSDNGRGVPDEIKEKVFVPFFTTRSEGTGLGLAICKRIAIDHGGDLTLSQKPGRTTFSLKLPF